MGTFKIKNITKTLGKRDANFNATLKIDYVDGMTKKTMLVKPDEITYLTAPSMPLSMHRMRIKNWITVEETNPKELKKLIAEEKKKKTPKIKVEAKKPKPTKAVTTQTTTKKARSYSKKKETDEK